jgi:hypothetical protein
MAVFKLNQSVTSQLVNIGQQTAGYITVIASLTNKMTSTVIELDNESLAAWLNEFGPSVGNLFTSHGLLGEAINKAADITAATIGGIQIAKVDIRSVAEKLAAQNRQIVIDEAGVFSVIPLPTPEPEPEPEPPPEPEPEPEPEDEL